MVRRRVPPARRYTGADRFFGIANYGLLTLAFMIVAYPLLYVLSASLSNSSAVIAGQVWLWPVKPTLVSYEAILRNSFLVQGFVNSIIYTVSGTAINVFMTILAAYPLSRRDFYGRGVITSVFVFTMLFSGGLIPTFLLVRSLGMIDTRWAMIIPGALSVWNMVIMRTYFQANIPNELHECAVLDGCGEVRFIVRVVLPLSTPIIAVMVLYYAIGHWNGYFSSLIYLRSEKLYPLQLVLRNILILNTTDPMNVEDPEVMQMRIRLAQVLKYSIIVVGSAPMLILYPFVQKYFLKGVMIGALKG